MISVRGFEPRGISAFAVPCRRSGWPKRRSACFPQDLNLRTWDKPAVACLSSRFAYGDPITVEKLRQVAEAESAVRRLGFSGFRVRHHDHIARIEVPRDQFTRAIECADELVERLARHRVPSCRA